MLNIPPRGRKIEEVNVLDGLLDKFELVIKREKKEGKEFVIADLSSEELLIREKEEKKHTALKQKIHQQLIKRLDVRKIDLISSAKNQQVKTIVEKTATFILSTEIDVDTMSRQEREEIIAEIVDEALGLGPLEALMSEPSITEIMVNKSDQIYVEQNGKLQLTDRKFINNDQVVQVIRKIVAPLGRRIDESMPFVDARLKDGSRINAIIPPLALQGPMLTIRRFPQEPLTGEDLIDIGSFTKEMLQFLSACIKMRKNVIISGGTGTGKTTLLNVLSAAIPEKERIITIEDTAELKLKQEHVGRLESRPPNVEGKGEVTIRDLVRNTLRMRPDRIIVGECRGAEALDMLQAMNTGHEGSMSTIHANTPRDMLSRLETMILMAGTELPLRAIREQIASAIHIVVQLSRFSDGTRKVIKITEVTGREKDVITVHDIFVFHRAGIEDKKITGSFQATGNIPRCYSEFKSQGIDLSVEIFRIKKNEKALNL
ncbi:CpaF family protein [bacterium]|nr:CpaF family protein [bacterium]